MNKNGELSFFKRRRGINKLQFTVVVISGVISLQWVVFQVVEYFFSNNLWKSNKQVGFYFIVVSIVLVIAVIGVSKIKETSLFKKPLKSDELNVYKEIIDRAMYEIDDKIFLSLICEQEAQENWENVLRIGEVSSSLFWKMARYDIRITNGKYMINAIDKLIAKGDQTQINLLRKKKAAVLIDDLGYTYVGKFNYNEAKNNIDEGMRLAEEVGAHVLVCKALRHLSGILLQRAENSTDEEERKQLLQEATIKYNESKNELKNVYNPIQKIELTAFLFYLMGRIKTAEKNYTAAIGEYKKAKKWFEIISDAGHGVKIFYQTGLAYELSGHDTSIVITHYKAGFKDAIRLVDNEQILKNGCALCRIFSEKKDAENFNFYFENVSKVASALKNEELLKELEGYKKKLNLLEVNQ